MTEGPSFGDSLKRFMAGETDTLPRTTDRQRDTRYCQSFTDAALRVRQPGADNSMYLAYDAAYRNVLSLSATRS